MKEKLTAETFRSLLNYDPTTGLLTWKTDRRSVQAGSLAGSALKHHSGKTYLYVRVLGRLYYSHRIAWAIHYGEMPPGNIDHRDGDSANNCIGNLRIATPRQNQYNKKITTRNKSGYKGVSFDKKSGMWATRINLPDGKQRFLGLHVSPKLAFKAYSDASAEVHGEFSRVS